MPKSTKPSSRVRTSSRAAPLKFDDRKLAGALRSGDGGPGGPGFRWRRAADLLAWSAKACGFIKRNQAVDDSGLADLKNVEPIAAGDFDNDGLPDLCVTNRSGAELLSQPQRQFRKASTRSLPAGHFTKRPSGWTTITTAIWICCCSAKFRRCCATTARPGSATRRRISRSSRDRRVDAAIFDLIRHDTNGMDLAVAYADRSGVIYRDRSDGKYEAMPLDVRAGGRDGLRAEDFNNDGCPTLRRCRAGCC